MPTYRKFIKDLNRIIGTNLPVPTRPVNYKSLEPFVLILPNLDVKQYFKD